MSSRVRGVSSSLLDSFTSFTGLDGFMRTAFLGAAFGVLGSFGTSFLGRPRFLTGHFALESVQTIGLGSGRIGLLSDSIATGGSSTTSGGPQRFLKFVALPLGLFQTPARPQVPE